MDENIFISRYYCARLTRVKKIVCVVEIFTRFANSGKYILYIGQKNGDTSPTIILYRGKT